MPDLHCDQGLNNPPIILEALVQGRRSINTPYMASSEIKAQGHPIYLNKGPHDAGLCECGNDTSKTCGQGKRVSSFFFFISEGWHECSKRNLKCQSAM